jgi:hypothetical protein
MIGKSPTQSKKRSSLKTGEIFPDNMTVEQFLALNKSKHIQWDSKVTVEDEQNSDLNEQHEHLKEKYKAAETHYQDIVIFIFYHIG